MYAPTLRQVIEDERRNKELIIEHGRMCRMSKVSKKLKKCHSCHRHFLPDMVTSVGGKITCYSCAKSQDERELNSEIVRIKKLAMFYHGVSFIVGVVLTACVYWVIK